MGSLDCVLDISNVYHATPLLLEGHCFSRLEPTAVLKDISARVYGGEILAILGSKGSGKRALLDIIAGRAIGEIRGRVTLNGSPLSLEMFRRYGGYVAHRCYLLPSLTVRQTLIYATWLANLKHRGARVRQTLADLALSQVANKCVNDLTKSEYRRLMLGVQIAKDPVILLLDEPTWDTDPLNTYLIISMLWSYATRRGSIVILTMETPRSDVLPFVNKVILLCLGAMVYSGPTRNMLDYFTNIGFPCPELENPLMYYLCLSTVDRRSKERFLESNQQISVLVDKFKTECGIYLKANPYGIATPKGITQDYIYKGIGYGIRPTCCSTLLSLYCRNMKATFAFNKFGMGHFAVRILLLPFTISLLSILYAHSSLVQSRIFLQLGGLIFNVLTLFYVMSIATTAALFPGFRMRYYQEKREGLYGGVTFLVAYLILSLPLSFVTTLLSTGILIPILELNMTSFLYTAGILWTSYVTAEQVTLTTLMIVKRPLTGAITVLYVILLSLVISSGGMRSLRFLPNWLAATSIALPTRYVSLALNQLAIDVPSLRNLAYNETISCPGMSDLCRYPDGKAFLIERFTREGEKISETLNININLLISLAFSLGLIIFNSLLYIVPLPSMIEAKFRE